MNLFVLSTVCVVSYLLGAISFSRIAAKKYAPEENWVDSRVVASTTREEFTLTGISATTIGNRLGEKAGCLVGILDMSKAFVPALALRLLFPEQPYHLAAAVMAMVGHNWPVYYGFKGGHGYSTVYGGLLAIDPIGAIVSSVVGMALGLFVVRDFMVAYLSGMWLLIPWMWLRWQDPLMVAYALAVNVIFMLAMIPEIKQVKSGLEKHGKSDLRTSMQDWPMGRGILKMADKLNIRLE
ncbi:hypothetical protein ADN00_11765 [Ornatilinea apprima]|uniref:Glycerol-3-phosphate acyltransferase n=1 Tax=Ornatilinea apprima TaxID=1134406 RepID=A0A0P6X125_9CHLR|nr:glycerol-3-phosphate acyltransferase [Ornatilinea apprima]KPL76031.1 hypothetical protein ADN00_11765 [Ornatilinea apprima]